MKSKVVLLGKLGHFLNWIYDTMRKLWCRATQLRETKKTKSESLRNNKEPDEENKSTAFMEVMCTINNLCTLYMYNPKRITKKLLLFL